MYIFYRKDGSALKLSTEEIIENALQQEADGVEPLFCWCDKRQAVTPPGWLVVSMWSGCCVVYRRKCDGKPIILTGWQGDFCAG